jgi:hypothetical protein
MHRFVIRCNIERFQRLLRESTDPAEAGKLRLLIAEQEAKLVEEERGSAGEPETDASRVGQPR